MFVTLEGIEGVGKSTQGREIQAFLNKSGIDCLFTREPGGTKMGEEIRDVLLTHRNETVSPYSELLLMFAARIQHLETIIKPALNAGTWVICDRFVDASYAYQGGGRGIPFSEIATVEKLVIGNFKPDLTFLFDLPVNLGLDRAKGRGAFDRFELEKEEFFARVRAAYLARAEAEPERFEIIDASHNVQEVTKLVLRKLESKIVHDKKLA